ncbi:hypothetical protein M758_UG313400 [Ceratodon purpureus]|nr:hypothetical protein M758_UG313400 [Ceratodon purpureus]
MPSMLALYLGFMFVNDAKAYSLKNPIGPVIKLVTSWRFQWLSGTLTACVLMDQNRSTHVV